MKRTLGIFAAGTLLCGAWGAALPPRCGPVPKAEPTKLHPPEGMPGGMSCEQVDEACETRARLEELLEARRPVESAEKAVEGLEEEARRQRALPGWTR